MPVAVLGNGGIEQAVPVAVNDPLHTGIAELCKPKYGACHPVIAFLEYRLVQYGGSHCHIAFFSRVTQHPHLNDIPRAHILHRQHLGQADNLPVQIHIVDAHHKVVALRKIQPDTGKARPVHLKGVGHIGACLTVGIGAVAVHRAGGNGYAISDEGNILSADRRPHVPRHTGGTGKQPVLE